jgi:hypothetical protein
VTRAQMENASTEAAIQGFGTVQNRIDAPHRLSMTYFSDGFISEVG